MEQCRGLIPVQDGYRRFLVGTGRDDRVHSISRLLRDNGNEVVLTRRDDPAGYAVDAVQEDADVLVTTIDSYAELEGFSELEDRLAEYGADDIYVAVDDPHWIDSIEDHADAVYHPDDSLTAIMEDLYRPFDWQYLNQVGERTYEVLEDWQEPHEATGDELSAYLSDEMGGAGKAAATKILNSNPALFES